MHLNLLNKIFFLAFQPIFRLPCLFRCARKSELFPPVRFFQQFVDEGRVLSQLLFKRDAICICSEEGFFFTTMNQFELKKKRNKNTFCISLSPTQQQSLQRPKCLYSKCLRDEILNFKGFFVLNSYLRNLIRSHLRYCLL